MYRGWSNGVQTGVAVGAIVLVVIIGASAGGSQKESASGTTTDTTTVTTESVVADAKGYQCGKSEFDFLRRCPTNPDFGKTRAQVKAAAVAKAKAARHARVVAQRAAAARRAAAKRAAAEQAAQIAAENAWHKGYNQQDENVYWKWDHSRSCEDYVTRCWHVDVITDIGCTSYVAVNANQYDGTAIVDQLLANQGYGIPPRTERVFELDSQSSGNQAGDVSVDCN